MAWETDYGTWHSLCIIANSMRGGTPECVVFDTCSAASRLNKLWSGGECTFTPICTPSRPPPLHCSVLSASRKHNMYQGASAFSLILFAIVHFSKWFPVSTVTPMSQPLGDPQWLLKHCFTMLWISIKTYRVTHRISLCQWTLLGFHRRKRCIQVADHVGYTQMWCWRWAQVVMQICTHKITLNHILSTQCVQQSLPRGHEKQNTSKLSMSMIPRQKEQGRATKQSKRSNTIVVLARYNMTEPQNHSSAHKTRETKMQFLSILTKTSIHTVKVRVIPMHPRKISENHTYCYL